MVSARSLSEQFKEIFWESLSEQISESETALFYSLIEENALTIRNPDDQELFYYSQSNIDKFLAIHLPDLVSFVPDRLFEWTKEALAFFKENADHEDFFDIFSTRLSYNIIIFNFTRFNFSTNGLRDKIIADLKIKSMHISEKYPPKLQALMIKYTKISINTTLRFIASELLSASRKARRRCNNKELRINRIKKEPSFTDLRGAVPFSIKNEQIFIADSSINDREQEYKIVLQRSFDNLRESNCLGRIHNKDPDLVRLFSEYDRSINSENGPSVAILWVIGQDIHKRIQLHQTGADSDDRIEQRDLYFIDSFMTAHNLYLQCFSMTETILQDMTRSISLYKETDAASQVFPWKVLESLGSAVDVTEARSARVMQKASGALSDGAGSQGLVAIGFGLLRGSLHAIGGAIIKIAVDILSKTTVDIGKESLIGALKQNGIYLPLIYFIQTHASSLANLSSLFPVYFGWIGQLLSSLGLA